VRKQDTYHHNFGKVTLKSENIKDFLKFFFMKTVSLQPEKWDEYKRIVAISSFVEFFLISKPT